MAAILEAVEASVKAAGDKGAPGGIIYCALMGKGCSLSQYQAIMRALVISGRIRQEGELYFANR